MWAITNYIIYNKIDTKIFAIYDSILLLLLSFLYSSSPLCLSSSSSSLLLSSSSSSAFFNFLFLFCLLTDVFEFFVNFFICAIVPDKVGMQFLLFFRLHSVFFEDDDCR